jgi:hypothetical protein
MAKTSDFGIMPKIIAVGVVALLAGVFIGTKIQKPEGLKSEAKMGVTGNKAPSGTHYNLNVIGVENPKTATLTDSSGHRIFVPLNGNCRINLNVGDFAVQDGNCTDGPAAFTLPDPATHQYQVWARALGKPGGSSKTTTCAELIDDLTGQPTTYCSDSSVVLERKTGKSSFGNVSADLLQLCGIDLDLDGVTECYDLFDPTLQNYFWSYDNGQAGPGLRLAQFRFYPVQ